jgi:capsule polysaccharide export protein KpsC/LpsZ
MVETYWAAKESDQEKIRDQLRIDLKSPLAVLFTNVVWDTAMQDRDTVFNGMLDWLQTTIRLFRIHPQWTLIIRIHPAETQVPGRESHDRVAEWIQQDLGCVPENVRVVLPEDPIDSYVLIRMARVGLVYASTVGLEMAVAGTPVVVAGDAHYSGKGFTYDPSDRENYSSQVEVLMAEQRAISRETQVDLALSYAYTFFLRRTLPITTLTEQHEARPRLAYHSFQELLPGISSALDVVCDGILTGREFEVHR